MDTVILAGGRGTRMHPLTLDSPKPLLPLGGRSLLEHQLEAVLAAGTGRIALSTGYRHEDFGELVTRVRGRGVDLRTVVEDRPLGTGGGLREALRALPGAETVLVLNGDLLTGHDLSAQVERLVAAGDEVLASLHVRDVPDPHNYGSVLVDGRDRVTAFVEKSASPPARTVNAGTYVVRHALLDRIPGEGTASLEREVFPSLADEDRVLAHRDDAYFRDVGSPGALAAANRDLVLGRLPGTPAEPTGALVLPGARVEAGARLGDGTVVHPDAVIGPDAAIEASLVLPGARIGAGARLRRSVVGRCSRVGAGARVRDCAIGTGESVEEGADLIDQRLPPEG